MKKIPIHILFLLFFINSFAQINQFAPVGAEWNFQGFSYNSNEMYYYDISIHKDTIIQDKTCSIVDYRNGLANEIIYSENQQVFVFRDSAFHLIFDFGASIGDTIMVFDSQFKPFFYNSSGADSVYLSYFNHFSYVVIDIDSSLIDSQWVELQTVESIGDWEFQTIQQKIGANSITGHILGNEKVSLIYSPPALYCYNDNDIQISLLENFNCTWLIGVEGVQQNTNYLLYPNPASISITLQFPQIPQESLIYIFNSLGQLKIQSTVKKGSSEKNISLETLPDGIYYWLLNDKKGKLIINK